MGAELAVRIRALLDQGAGSGDIPWKVKAFALKLGVCRRAIYGWLNGESEPNAENMTNLCDLFRLYEGSREYLVALRDREAVARKQCVKAHLYDGGSWQSGSTKGSGAQLDLESDVEADSRNLDALLKDCVHQLSRFPRSVPASSYAHARAIQQRALHLIETDHRVPRRDLYRVAGFAGAGMANAALLLGDGRLATWVSRTVLMMGELSGVDWLCVWARGMRALIAIWMGDYRLADNVTACVDASEKIRGTARIRLLCIRAHALGHLGRSREAEVVMSFALRLRDGMTGSDEFDGVLTYPIEKQWKDNANTFAALGTGKHLTKGIRMADEAIRLYTAVPASRRRIGELSQGYLTRALLDVHCKDIESAAMNVATAISLAKRRPTFTLEARIDQIMSMLGPEASQFRRDQRNRSLK